MQDVFRKAFKDSLLATLAWSAVAASSSYADLGVLNHDLDPILLRFGAGAPGGTSGDVGRALQPAPENCTTDPAVTSGGPSAGSAPEVQQLTTVDALVEWARTHQSEFLPNPNDSAEEKRRKHQLRYQLSMRLDILYRQEHAGTVNTTDQVDQEDLWRISRTLQRKGVSAESYRNRILETLKVANFSMSSSDVVKKAEAYTQSLISKGVRYRFGGESLRGMDCSGFIINLAEVAADVAIARTTVTIRNQIRGMRDDQGKKIAVNDPRQIPVGEIHVLAYGSGSTRRGRWPFHTVALLRYPDGTVKVFESTRRGSRNGPKARNYSSIDKFLRERGILRGNRIAKNPAAASLDKMHDAQNRNGG